MIKIDKGIPIPKPLKLTPRSGTVMSALREMEVGDSIAFPRASKGIYQHALTPKRFTIRKQPDGTYRCWRIE
jgi:hypothetical protein